MTTKSGFTIIETVTYLGILSLILAVILPTFYFVTTETRESQISFIESEETSFMLEKINNLISSAILVEEPRVGQKSNVLKIRLNDSARTLVEIRENNNFIFVKRGGEREQKINPGWVKIFDLEFARNPSTGLFPDSLSYSFSVDSYKIPTTTIEISRHE